MPRLVLQVAPVILAVAGCAVPRFVTAATGATAATSAPAPLPGICPELAKEQSSYLEAHSITAQDNGKSMVIHRTDRFSVYLDNATYPFSELTASPEGMLGYISNGSIRGPRCYPIVYEAVTEGMVVLKDRDFQLQVEIDNSAPVSTFPLH